jgi:polysaccharide biosynthesis protein PslH
VVAGSSTGRAEANVLVLANRLPYPIDDGWKARTFHVVRGLARRSHTTLLVFDDSSPARLDAFRASVGGSLDIVQVPAPRSNSPVRLLLGAVTRTPFHVWNMRSRQYARELSRLMAERRPDVVVAELTGMYAYLLDLPRRGLRIIDTHNIDSVVFERYARGLPQLPRRLYARMTVGKQRRLEKRVFGDADQVWVCSSAEVDVVRGLCPSACAVNLPNGVDTTHLAPGPADGGQTTRLLFFGRMDYHPNRDALHYFVGDILPVLRRSWPDVTLDVVGAGIDAGMRALAETNPEVRLIGRIDDIREAIAGATIVVVPLRMGGGTRLKILEAMAMGRPVVSTSIGAEGLDLRDGHDILLADSPTDFANTLERLLHDTDARAALGARGRATAVERYDWSRIEEQIADQLGWTMPLS